LDHVVAMGSGIVERVLGCSSDLDFAGVFPLVTAVGGVFGVLGVPMPAVETGIALSGVILELDGSFCRKALLKIAGAIVGIFAIFHGHAHGSELPEAVSVITYAAGFVIATGLLHLSGIAIGLLARWPWGKIAVRTGGAVTAAVGFGFLLNVF
jgi:urease accessory protein